jgi:hypothetical protein
VTLAASGIGDGPGAVEQAILDAAQGLQGDAPAVVLVFPSADLPAEDVAEQLAPAARAFPVAGMTSDMLIANGAPHARGCAALALGSDVTAGVGVARHASRDLRAAGRAAAEAAMEGVELRPGHAVMLLFVDPDSGDEAATIDGAYSAVGGAIPLAGGGCNGPPPSLIAGDALAADAVVAVAISSAHPIGVGLAHGCRPLGAPAIATRTDGRAVRELNGRPAEEVYLEALGLDAPLEAEQFEALAVLHPLAQAQLRGHVRLRHVSGRAAGGGLACATTIAPNAGVWFTEQTEETIISSAHDAVDAALQALDAPPRAGLVFDCAARKRALRDRIADEATVLLQAFEGVPALTGVYTRGEIGRTRGAKGDRNHVLVAVAFG